MVSSIWDKGPTKGMVTNSIVSFVVRKGNPKHIKTWADLVKPGIKVITPNPFSSGSAKWNLLAAYGAQLGLGQEPRPRPSLPDHLLPTASPSRAVPARRSQTFLSGEGDVLLDYQDDALYAQARASRSPSSPRPRRSSSRTRSPSPPSAKNPAGQGLRGLPALAGRAEDLGQAGIPAGAAHVAKPVQVPHSRRSSSPSTPSAAGPRSTRLLRPDHRDRGEDRARAWGSRQPVADRRCSPGGTLAGRSPAAPARRRLRRAGRARPPRPPVRR